MNAYWKIGPVNTANLMRLYKPSSTWLAPIKGDFIVGSPLASPTPRARMAERPWATRLRGAG